MRCRWVDLFCTRFSATTKHFVNFTRPSQEPLSREPIPSFLSISPRYYLVLSISVSAAAGRAVGTADVPPRLRLSGVYRCALYYQK